MGYAIGAAVVVVAAFLIWRITSVERGARLRDRKLFEVLDPLSERFDKGAEVTADEIHHLCRKYELRPMLYSMLNHYEKLDLFPKECATWEGQAEGILAYWMMHPNELQNPPAMMECVQRVERQLEGRNTTFIVVRFRMPPGHWAGENRWLLGLSGPFLETEVPYSGTASAFSRSGDIYGETQPEQLVDWYVNMLRKKTGRVGSPS